MSTYIKKKSQKQERRTAKEFGGKLTPASGALSGAKGDVRTGTRNGGDFNNSDFLIENKYTDKSYYSLKLSIWEKIAKEALRDNFRTEAMQVDIQNLSLFIISKMSFSILFGDDHIFISEINLDKTRKSTRLCKNTIDGHIKKALIRGIPFFMGINFVNTSLVLMKLEDFFSLRDFGFKVDKSYIPLPNREKAFIDEEDYDKCKNILWHKNGRGYVIGKIDGKPVKLHRFLLNVYDSSIGIDHIDRNKLNNRKANLREASSTLNSINRDKFNLKSNVCSVYKGVSKRRKTDK